MVTQVFFPFSIDPSQQLFNEVQASHFDDDRPSQGFLFSGVEDRSIDTPTASGDGAMDRINDDLSDDSSHNESLEAANRFVKNAGHCH